MPHINTGKGNPIRSGSRTIPIPTIHAVRRHQYCIPQDSGSNRKILHVQNRRAPLNLDGVKQSQKTSSLLGQAYHLTWCTNIYPKTFNHTWGPSATSKMPHINTGKGNPIRSGSRTIPIPTIHAVRRHQYCIPQDSGFNRKILHGQNRKVPSYIQKGQQIYPGCLSLLLQQHPCRTSENKIRPRFKDSLPKKSHLIDQQRLETSLTYPGQWMSQCSQKFHEGGKRKISGSPTPHQSQKLSRMGHLNLQGAFHSRTI